MSRNLHYKSFSFRLSDDLAEEIKNKKKQSGLSYNQFFSQTTKNFDVQKYLKKMEKVKEKIKIKNIEKLTNKNIEEELFFD